MRKEDVEFNSKPELDSPETLSSNVQNELSDDDWKLLRSDKEAKLPNIAALGFPDTTNLLCAGEPLKLDLPSDAPSKFGDVFFRDQNLPGKGPFDLNDLLPGLGGTGRPFDPFSDRDQAHRKGESYRSPDGSNQGYLLANKDGSIKSWKLRGEKGPIASLEVDELGQQVLFIKGANGGLEKIAVNKAVLKGSNLLVRTVGGGELSVDINTGKVVNDSLLRLVDEVPEGDKKTAASAGAKNDFGKDGGVKNAGVKNGDYGSPDGANRGYLSRNEDGTISVWNVIEKEGFHKPIVAIEQAPDGSPVCHLRLPNEDWKDSEIKLTSAILDGTTIKMTRKDGGQLWVDANSGQVVNETCSAEKREQLRADLINGKSIDDGRQNNPGLRRKNDGSVSIGTGSDEHLLYRPEWDKQAHNTAGDAKGPARRWNDTLVDEYYRSGQFNGDEEGLAKTIARAQKELSKQEFTEFTGYIKKPTNSEVHLDRGDDPLEKITIGNDKFVVQGGEVFESHRSNPLFESTQATVKKTDKGVLVTDARGGTWDIKLKDVKEHPLPSNDVQEAVMRNKEAKEIATIKTVDGKLVYDFKGIDGKWQPEPIVLTNIECKQDGSLVMHAEDGRVFERLSSGAMVHRDAKNRPILLEDANCNVYHFNWAQMPAGIPTSGNKKVLEDYLRSHPYEFTKVGPDTGWVEQTYTAKSLAGVALDKLWTEFVNENFEASPVVDPGVLRDRFERIAGGSETYTLKNGNKCQPSTTSIGAALGFTPAGSPFQLTIGIGKPTQQTADIKFDPDNLELTITDQSSVTDQFLRRESTTFVFRADATRTIVTTKNPYFEKPQTTRQDVDKNGQTQETNGAPQ